MFIGECPSRRAWDLRGLCHRSVEQALRSGSGRSGDHPEPLAGWEAELPEPALTIAVPGLEDEVAAGPKLIAVEFGEIGDAHPLSGEKLSLVLTVFRATVFEGVAAIAAHALAYRGAGRLVGIFRARDSRAIAPGRALSACRVIVNRPRGVASGGLFTNPQPPSRSMHCGNRGDSIDRNHPRWRHVQTARILPDEPSRVAGPHDISDAGRAVSGQ